MSIRVLHVVRSLRPETGGLAEAVRQLAAAQRARGDSATVVSLDPADAADRSVMMLGRATHGYGRTPALGPWLATHRAEFDAVVAHGLWQYQSYAVWRALRRTTTPYLVFPHGMLDVWFKRAHPLKHLKKWLYWPWAEYRVLRDAAAVCFTAEDERRRARQSFWLYRARERILPIGIEAPAGDPAAQRAAFFAAYPPLRERPFVLFLGRIHPKKGVDLLLRGYARAFTAGAADSPRLVVAGPCDDEAYRRGLLEEANRLGIAAATTWLPMLTGESKWGALHSCEAFVLLSHQENFGVAVVEALACGRPVLLSDQIAIAREIVADGAGLVATDTVEGAVQLLTRWRALPPVSRTEMSAQARTCFARRYEIGRAAAALAEIVAERRIGSGT